MNHSHDIINGNRTHETWYCSPIQTDLLIQYISGLLHQHSTYHFVSIIVICNLTHIWFVWIVFILKYPRVEYVPVRFIPNILKLSYYVRPRHMWVENKTKLASNILGTHFTLIYPISPIFPLFLCLHPGYNGLHCTWVNSLRPSDAYTHQ